MAAVGDGTAQESRVGQAQGRSAIICMYAEHTVLVYYGKSFCPLTILQCFQSIPHPTHKKNSSPSDGSLLSKKMLDQPMPGGGRAGDPLHTEGYQQDKSRQLL